MSNAFLPVLIDIIEMSLALTEGARKRRRKIMAQKNAEREFIVETGDIKGATLPVPNLLGMLFENFRLKIPAPAICNSSPKKSLLWKMLVKILTALILDILGKKTLRNFHECNFKVVFFAFFIKEKRYYFHFWSFFEIVNLDCWDIISLIFLHNALHGTSF